MCTLTTSHARICVSESAGLPDPDLFGGYDKTVSAVHDPMRACPGVGDTPVPDKPVRPPS